MSDSNGGLGSQRTGGSTEPVVPVELPEEKGMPRTVGYLNKNVWILLGIIVRVFLSLPGCKELFEKVVNSYDEKAEGVTSKEVVIAQFRSALLALTAISAVTNEKPATVTPVQQPLPPPPVVPASSTTASTPQPAPYKSLDSFDEALKARQAMATIEPVVAQLMAALVTRTLRELYPPHLCPNGFPVFTIGTKYFIALHSVTGELQGRMYDLRYIVDEVKGIRNHPNLAIDSSGRPFIRSVEAPDQALPPGESRWIRVFELSEGMRVRYVLHDKLANSDETQFTLYYRVLGGKLQLVTEDHYRS